MPDTPSITIVQRFPYRGIDEEWSNTYHFSGTTPANDAAWKALADAIIASMADAFTNQVSWVAAYGYEAGNELSVFQYDYTALPGEQVIGTFNPGTAPEMPGDVAATTRWTTPDTTSRGKRIYLRKYWHGVHSNGQLTGDTLYAAQKTELDEHAAKLIDGTLPGGFKYCGPQGAVASDPVTNPNLTTRTLKRRGKRPNPSAP